MNRARLLLTLPLLLALSASLVGLPGIGQSAPAPAMRKRFTNSIGIKLVRIPAGRFKMGSPHHELGR
jgi:hypothetical protein